MAKKHFVVQGATLKCNCSVEPKTDILKVKSHSKHYANDHESTEKLIATDKEIGQTLEKNTFGKCKMQPNGSGDFLPCQVVITKWSDAYQKLTLSNKGKVLLENSKATCPMGTPDCIEVAKHGQKQEMHKMHFMNAPETVSMINPLVNMTEFKNEINGIFEITK
ncbi:DUF4280 domain-containing protein [Flavobacterium psychrophilum]|nr:DUF4280 domain-containing protein [Flavobacterium psychrophilum]